MLREKLRAWWSYRQGLDGSLIGKSAAEVLTASGWSRSVAGAGPYLTFFSRAGLRREAVDAALARTEIHELPAARGCTYVLPSCDFALGLQAGECFTAAELAVGEKLGVTNQEIRKLRSAVAKALENGPLDPERIKATTGDAVRSLGQDGIRKGMTTTLPLALGLMQAAGEIRRIPVNGRLDRQRYLYALWKPNPLASGKLSAEECLMELAPRYFRWTGVATLAGFQRFCGAGVKAAKIALEPLRLETLTADYLITAEDRSAFESFQVPKEPQYTLVGSLDSMIQLRHDTDALLDPEDRGHELVRLKPGAVDLPHHAIFDRGRLAGFWEFDPEKEVIAWTSFVKPDRELRKAVAETEAFVRDDLGDARSFSLDSPKSRVPRIEALRKAAAA